MRGGIRGSTEGDARPVVSAGAVFRGLITETDLLRAALLADASGDEPAKPRGEAIVSEWKDRFESELAEVRRLRDELNVRIHLAKADARDHWEKLEHEFHRLEAKARQLSQATEEPLRDVRDAAGLLIDEIRDGYRRIRAAL